MNVPAAFKITGLIVLFLLVAWIAWGYLSVRNIEEPEYTVIEQKETYEIREYAPYLIAETTVSGDYRSSMNQGFMVIADYIFGNNTSKLAKEGNEPIAMTTPVVSEESEPIAMTAPVISEESEPIAMTAPVIREGNQERKISFVMPSQYTLETLPSPNNEQVAIREIQARKVAVIRFSGWFREKNFKSSEEQLLKALQKDGYKAGKISYAGYNPPWTPPFMTRNEVWIELQD